MDNFSSFYNASNEELDKLLSEVISDNFPDNQRLSPAEFAGAILNANRTITLDTLRVYHEWLSEQLGK